MRLAAEELIQIPILPSRHAVGQEHPQPVADDLERHGLKVVSRIGFFREGFDLDDVFLPPGFLGRHHEPHPLIAAAAGELDRLAVDLASFVPQDDGGGLGVAIKGGHDDVDHRGVPLGNGRRGFDAMHQHVADLDRVADRHDIHRQIG